MEFSSQRILTTNIASMMSRARLFYPDCPIRWLQDHGAVALTKHKTKSANFSAFSTTPSQTPSPSLTYKTSTLR